jgi:hypothetical protein
MRFVDPKNEVVPAATYCHGRHPCRLHLLAVLLQTLQAQLFVELTDIELENLQGGLLSVVAKTSFDSCYVGGTIRFKSHRPTCDDQRVLVTLFLPTHLPYQTTFFHFFRWLDEGPHVVEPFPACRRTAYPRFHTKFPNCTNLFALIDRLVCSNDFRLHLFLVWSFPVC